MTTKATNGADTTMDTTATMTLHRHHPNNNRKHHTSKDARETGQTASIEATRRDSSAHPLHLTRLRPFPRTKSSADPHTTMERDLEARRVR